MEVLLALPIIMIPFFWPIITGLMAQSFGRKFWFWFFVGIPLPFIATIILLFLPDKRKTNINTGSKNNSPVSNEELFNHLTSETVITKKTEHHEVYFSASA